MALISLLLLWDTQLHVMDVLVRNLTDISWGISDKVRSWAKGDIRRVYYTVFAGYMLFRMWAMWQAAPLVLLLLGANARNIAGMVTVPLVMWANKQLPKEIQPRIWENISNVIFWICNIFFAIALGLAQIGIKIF
ncbi:MAG: hypothetical protein AOA65_1584 [Candidatus Bathyarchaeota archaeon BA1]|nr:MAG: hypothetical protein AOA65_1584 [Candidatus Bathyarchaeota archaeon BA1]